jgi:hypothetical protein
MIPFSIPKFVISNCLYPNTNSYPHLLWDDKRVAWQLRGSLAGRGSLVVLGAGAEGVVVDSDEAKNF